MTITELQALTHDALNELAAKCMGWHKGAKEYWRDKNNYAKYNYEGWDGHESGMIDYWCPAYYLDHAAILEAEIARCGLQDVYFQTVQELWRNVPVRVGFAWFLMTAPPHLRTVAAVHVLQGEAQ